MKTPLPRKKHFYCRCVEDLLDSCEARGKNQGLSKKSTGTCGNKLEGKLLGMARGQETVDLLYQLTTFNNPIQTHN
ncbi:hypothetical protein SKAU_G00165710 [Synaphobranchus kaupii]|uniref:Uncharacterized protein n=1 Tax=Synaphobranchus kaupii TaxID=118154 RepID=A0A9Q1IZB3_SYNKA|nr:hypothetical protein SKAU_G00165710 [Synaphobranchus kaupii]